jgi:monoamine oxidase
MPISPGCGFAVLFTSHWLVPMSSLRSAFICGCWLLAVAVFGMGSVRAAPPKADARPSVVIIGAGLAGLTTAYKLKQAGIAYTLLESTPHIGGRVRTPAYPEQVSAEAGLEEFWGDNPLLDIFRELKVPLEASATAFSSYRYQGKIIPFTQETNLAFIQSILSPGELTAYQQWDKQMAGYYAKLQTRPLDRSLADLQKVSFAEWVGKHSGLSDKIQNLIRIESEPEYATSWERISALEGIAEWHIFLSPGTPSFHVIGGNQAGVDALADAVGREKIQLNTQATHVKSTAAGVEVTTTNVGSFAQKTFKADYVVSTVPLYRLFEIHFDPPLSAERVNAIQTQTWGAYFTAHLILDKAAAQYWTVNKESILPIITDSPLGVIYGGNSPEKPQNNSVEILNFLVTGDFAEQFNARTESLDHVREQMSSNLEKLWPGISKHIIKWAFYRYHPRAIASWPVGRSRFDAASDALRQPQGRVYLAGDFTEGTHSDGAARSAVRVVGQILAAQRPEPKPQKP